MTLCFMISLLIVHLNYSVSVSQYGNNNTNIYISKLMLLRTPQQPIGDLYLERTFGTVGQQWVKLVPGTTFNDKDGRLRYMVRLDSFPKRYGVDTFYFRAENNYGDVCSGDALGTVSFNVVSHLLDVTTRQEVARMGVFAMYVLRGNGTYNTAVLTGLPDSGTLYEVSPKAPWLQLSPGQVYWAGHSTFSVGQKYCDLVNCDNIVGAPLTTGSNVRALRYLNESGSFSPWEIRVCRTYTLSSDTVSAVIQMSTS